VPPDRRYFPFKDAFVPTEYGENCGCSAKLKKEEYRAVPLMKRGESRRHLLGSWERKVMGLNLTFLRKLKGGEQGCGVGGGRP